MNYVCTSLDGLDIVWSKLSFNKTWFYEILDGKLMSILKDGKVNYKMQETEGKGLSFFRHNKLGNYIGEKVNEFQ